MEQQEAGSILNSGLEQAGGSVQESEIISEQEIDQILLAAIQEEQVNIDRIS